MSKKRIAHKVPMSLKNADKNVSGRFEYLNNILSKDVRRSNPDLVDHNAVTILQDIKMIDEK